MTKNSNTKDPRPNSLKWFEERVGEFIYRAPFFDIEKGRDAIPMKIKNKEHAKILFDLQRPGRPGYVDKREDVHKGLSI